MTRPANGEQIINRRDVIVGLCALLAGAHDAHAGSAVVNIEWDDLVPKQGGLPVHPQRARGVIQHGQLSNIPGRQAATKLTRQFDGKRVRIGGYLVPLDFEMGSSKEFLLAPFVGACIHVPPPPANQLILVSSRDPYILKRLSDPVYVTGDFSASLAKTKIAEIGYVMRSARIAPFGF